MRRIVRQVPSAVARVVPTEVTKRTIALAIATTRARDRANTRVRDTATTRARDRATTRVRGTAITRVRDNVRTLIRGTATTRVRNNVKTRVQLDNDTTHVHTEMTRTRVRTVKV